MNKKIVRIFCIVLVVLLVLTMFTGVIGSLLMMPTYAATGIFDIEYVRTNGGRNYTVPGDLFETQITMPDSKDKYDKVKTSTVILDYKEKDFTLSGGWVAGASGNTKIEVLLLDEENGTYIFTVKNASNANLSTSSSPLIKITSTGMNKLTSSASTGEDIHVKFSEDQIKKPSTTTGTSTEFTPNPIIESIVVNDKTGTRIDNIDEKTAPFTLVVTYLEFGLEETDFDNIPDRALSAYIDSLGGFKSERNLRGEIQKILSSKDGTPRFQIVFRDLVYEKDGANDLTLKIVYELDNEHHLAPLAVKIKEAKIKKEEEDEDKIAPLKPYIIVNQYSFGKEQIIAGTDFSLNISYTNTSTDIPLENIVMTVTPDPEYLTIASSSNTIYVPSLAGKSTLSHSIDLKAIPNAKVGSAEVTIDFTYQYVDLVNKKREEGKTTEKIAIPITQIDRFAIDPITELPQGATVGEPFFLTITFINRGKSPTYNISAQANSKQEMISAGVHYDKGNLEPGKSDSIEFSITAAKAGELVGEVVVQYEDENTNQKELKTPFSVYIEEPYVPDFPDPNMMNPEDPEAPPLSTPTLIFAGVGSLLVAAPIAFYFIKRGKLKESEAFDEDF